MSTVFWVAASLGVSFCGLQGWLAWLRFNRYLVDRYGLDALCKTPGIARAYRAGHWPRAVRSIVKAHAERRHVSDTTSESEPS